MLVFDFTYCILDQNFQPDNLGYYDIQVDQEELEMAHPHFGDFKKDITVNSAP